MMIDRCMSKHFRDEKVPSKSKMEQFLRALGRLSLLALLKDMQHISKEDVIAISPALLKLGLLHGDFLEEATSKGRPVMMSYPHKVFLHFMAAFHAMVYFREDAKDWPFSIFDSSMGTVATFMYGLAKDKHEMLQLVSQYIVTNKEKEETLSKARALLERFSKEPSPGINPLYNGLICSMNDYIPQPDIHSKLYIYNGSLTGECREDLGDTSSLLTTVGAEVLIQNTTDSKLYRILSDLANCRVPIQKLFVRTITDDGSRQRQPLQLKYTDQANLNLSLCDMRSRTLHILLKHSTPMSLILDQLYHVPTAVFSHLAHQKQLQALGIWGGQYDCHLSRELCLLLPKLPNLQCFGLYLEPRQISGWSLTFLKKAALLVTVLSLCKLEQLFICKIDFSGVLSKSLPRLRTSNAHIEVLVLNETGLVKEDVHSLEVLIREGRLPALDELYLQRNDFTNFKDSLEKLLRTVDDKLPDCQVFVSPEKLPVKLDTNYQCLRIQSGPDFYKLPNGDILPINQPVNILSGQTVYRLQDSGIHHAQPEPNDYDSNKDESFQRTVLKLARLAGAALKDGIPEKLRNIQQFQAKVRLLEEEEYCCSVLDGEKATYQELGSDVSVTAPQGVRGFLWLNKIHTEFSKFATSNLEKDNFCVAGPIADLGLTFRERDQATGSDEKPFQIKLPHCIRIKEHFGTIKVWCGNIKKGQPFRQILSKNESNGVLPYYELEQTCVRITTAKFCQYACTACSEVHTAFIRCFPFGLLSPPTVHIPHTDAKVKVFLGCSLYSISDFQSNLVQRMEKLGFQLLEEMDILINCEHFRPEQSDVTVGITLEDTPVWQYTNPPSDEWSERTSRKLLPLTSILNLNECHRCQPNASAQNYERCAMSYGLNIKQHVQGFRATLRVTVHAVSKRKEGHLASFVASLRNLLSYVGLATGPDVSTKQKAQRKNCQEITDIRFGVFPSQSDYQHREKQPELKNEHLLKLAGQLEAKMYLYKLADKLGMDGSKVNFSLIDGEGREDAAYKVLTTWQKDQEDSSAAYYALLAALRESELRMLAGKLKKWVEG